MKSIIKISFLLSILAACSPARSLATTAPTLAPSRISVPSETPIPSDTLTLTSTITPTFTITPTSTFQPPLGGHEWYPELVLISMRSNFGDGGAYIGDAGSPPFILYVDGSLFIHSSKNINGKYYNQVLTKKLNRKEICQNLNTLDHIGYLDYDPSNYSFIGGKPLGEGAPDTFITVNAWKAMSYAYYELGYFLQKNIVDAFYGQKGYPVISPALRNAYYFLNQYPNEGFEVYKPNRLAVWIVPAEYIFPDNYKSIAQTWQLKNPTFDDLLKRVASYPEGRGNNVVIVNNNEAKTVYNFLDDVEATKVFVVDTADGKKAYYALLARPLLPYEILGDYDISQLPAPGSPKPNFKLSCYPSDGVLSIPTPIP